MNQNVNPDIKPIIVEFAKELQKISEILQQTIIDHREELSGFAQTMDNLALSWKPILRDLQKIAVVSSKMVKQIKTVDELAKVQFVSYGLYETDLLDEVVLAENADRINRVLEERFCNKGNRSVAEIANKCRQHKLMAKYKYIFSQSLKAFKKCSFDLAIMGLFSILDGLLSDVSFDNSPKTPERLKKFQERLFDDENEISKYVTSSHFFLKSSVYKVFGITYSNSSKFSEEEPDAINRHWIMHGRSTRKKTKLDFLKILRLLYGLLLLSDLVSEKDVAA